MVASGQKAAAEAKRTGYNQLLTDIITQKLPQEAKILVLAGNWEDGLKTLQILPQVAS